MKMKALGWVFWAVILFSLGLTLSNYNNYLGLLGSMNEVVYSIDDVSHKLDESKVEFTISFSLLNPTSYGQLKFTSLQCQLYLVEDGQEQFLGATGYAPPVDVPLHSDEVRSYSTVLSVSAGDLMEPDGELVSEVDLRLRNVVHFSTPIRSFYQSFNINMVSHLDS